MGKLEEMGVNLNTIAWYATGGKGFHAELPMELFFPKVPRQGVKMLPQIYKEMAFSLYVDTMDMRVYSARKGRQWRTTNVLRESKKYKVPVTVAEIADMTAEQYHELCTGPRPKITLAKPELVNDLALLYAKAEQKVAAASKRKDTSARDAKLLAKFGGDFPPSVLRMMKGEGLSTEAGFHQIAMQIAITANALGKKEDQTAAMLDTTNLEGVDVEQRTR